MFRKRYMKANWLTWIAAVCLLPDWLGLARAQTQLPEESNGTATPAVYRISTAADAKRDWGDAPAVYPTTLANNGARHVISLNILLGQLIDAEADGQPSANARGDDTNPAGSATDEDGVALPARLVPGQAATFVVTVKLTGLTSASLNCWIDFNRSGNWGQSGERVLTNRPVVNGLNTLNFIVPASASVGLTAARFRLSSAQMNAPTGDAPDGEVEDYAIEITATEEPQSAGIDFGDAAQNYPVTIAQQGAAHRIEPGFFLGQRVDAELDGKPSATATGDDTDPAGGPDDEDGVTVAGSYIPGQSVTAQVTASQAGKLDAWVDWNGDGTWASPSEQIFTNRTVAAGLNSLNVSVPANAKIGSTLARFRFSRQGALAPTIPTGAVLGGKINPDLLPEGEVEDYPVLVQEAENAGLVDFGDAPNAAPFSFPTLRAENGARHITLALVENQPFVLFGTKVDLEADGQPSSGATADDTNDTHVPAPADEDDEDGVTFTTPLNPGQPATVRVVVSSFAIEFRWLNAWIDFDGDGTWNQANEKIFSGREVQNGSNDLNFVVPANAHAGTAYARFRLTGANSPIPALRDITFTGLMPIGEVEDYAVRIERPPGGGPCEGDNTGSDFWLAFPGNYAPDPTNSVNARLRIVGTNGVTGTVEVPGLAFTQAFTIGASGFAAILLPDSAELGSASDLIESKGIHVTASANVSVYGINQVDFTSDGFLSYATPTLGREYLVQTYGNVHTGIPELNGTQFALVACESNTVVTITPTASTARRAANVPYTLTLERGQTYQLRCTEDAPADLSGTRIVASKPLAVFGSHRVANIQSADTSFADYLVEQLLPSTRAGLEFITAPLATRRGDSFRFFATADGTEITVGSSPPVVRNHGEFIEKVLAAGTRVTATQPILAQQYANSADYEGTVNADPFMLTLAHTGQFLDEYRVVTAGSEFLTHYANIIIPTSGKGTLLLDGAATGATFVEVTGSIFSYAQIELTSDTHTFSAATRFGLTIYGWNAYESYGWLGGISFGDTTPPTVTCPVEKISIIATGLDGIPCLARVPDFRGRVTVTDNCQLLPDSLVTQTPAPNSIIRAGLYTLTFEARDTHGNLGICSTPLEVLGSAAPFMVNCPDGVLVPCDDAAGARVFFSVTAGENCQDNIPVICTPPSGNIFPVGNTRVTCVAVNPANGQRVTCEFIVRVECGITPVPTRPEIRISRLSADGTIDIDLEIDGVLERADDLGRTWREVPIEPPPAPGLQIATDDQIMLDAGVKRRHRLRPTGDRGFFRIRRR